MNYFEDRKIIAPYFLAFSIVLFLALFDPFTAYVSNETLSGTEAYVFTKDEAQEFIDNFESIAVLEPGDTTPPLILGSNVVKVEVGAKSIPGPLMCVDDVDKSVHSEIIGKYNLNKIGSYKLKRIATDSSGNSIIFPFTLKVVEELGNFTEETKGSPLLISDAISLYKTSDTQIGIDVSKWQGKIDWKAVAASGVEFAILRLGVQEGFGGNCLVDETFIDNFQGARAAGLKVGVYFYSYSTSLLDSFNQGVFVLQTLRENNFKPDFPIVFDWEAWSKFGSLGMSINDLNDCAKMFFDVVETEGYEGTLYSSKYYLENGIWNLPNYKTWLANYTKQTSYQGEYFMWQCSCTGSVPGIYGDVDIDVLYINK